ncbi:VWA domain-containing protein [Dokdonia sp. Hel_I_53]|uniref:VWA domain-containing protein n=1 Tax=Dokdonia sp. Hel_I_53 TaxID=1566287 RepID=UPI0011A93646|nr:VWA domain-containing protein [Dokdonia sp. Hel_I_53]
MQKHTLLLLIGAAILSLGVAGFQYFYNTRSVTKRNKVYALLRFFSIFCLLTLLINPSYKQVSYFTEKPTLAIAIDNSSSIKYLDYDLKAVHAVDRFRESESLSKLFDLDFYSFGEEFKTLDSLTFKDRQTSISASLNGLEAIYGNAIAPVVLMTDGNQTYGEDFKYTTQNYKQQVYPIILGDTLVYEDLRIGQVNVNRYAYINNKFPVEIFTTYTGNKDTRTRLSIKSGSTTLFSKTLNFNQDNTSQVINALIPASTVGVKQFKISLSPLIEEKNTNNNFKNFAVEIIDQKTNILLISSIVHPDIGMLKKSIESNRLRTLEINKPSKSISKINDYELVILYQPDASFKRVFEELKSLNKNAITITGAATDWRSLNSFQSTVKQEITGQEEEVQGKLNINFSSFVIPDLDFSNLPPLTTAFGEVTFTTNIDVAVTQQIGSLQTANPLIVTTDQNGRRGVYVLGEGLWRWRAQSFIDHKSFEKFDGFIDNLVQYAASNTKKSRLTLEYERFYYGNGEVRLYAQYFDKNYNFNERARLTINVVNQETKVSSTIPLLLKGNTYLADLNNLNAGEYSFTVSVEGQGLSRSGTFTIIPFEIEQQFLNANVTSLSTLASNTKSTLYSIDEVDQLISALLNDKRYRPVQKSVENIVPLIDWRWLLALLAIFLTAEWLMRKYNGLT